MPTFARSIRLGARVSTLSLGALALVASCSGSNNQDAGPAPTYTVGSCATAGQAPLRDGAGHVNCTAVGASTTAATGDWGDLTGAATPIVYVRPGATGGDGSMAMPFGDIDTALASTPTPATIAVSRGTLTLAHPVHFTGRIDIIGAGPAGGSLLSCPAGAQAVEMAGPGAIVTMKGFAIEYTGTAVAGDTSAAIEATGGATATISNVTISGAHDGVRAMASTLHADHVTVRSGQRHGILVTLNSTATMDSVWVSDTSFAIAGDGVGIAVAQSHLDIQNSLVENNARDGLVFNDGIAGMVNHVTGVVSVHNGVTAMRAEGMNCSVELSLVSLSDTQIPTGTVGGDGLFVGGGAQASIDPGMGTMAMRGLGSEIVGNSRSGILASGSMTSLQVRAALIGHNQAPGLFMQDAAGAQAVEFTDIGANGILGVGVTSGAQAVEMVGNNIHHTVMGTLTTSTGAVTLGDGLSMTEGTGTATVNNNEFSGNARFGAVFNGANANLVGNVGVGNLYGVGAYAAIVSIDSTNSIGGSMAAPATAPDTARGLVAF